MSFTETSLLLREEAVDEIGADLQFFIVPLAQVWKQLEDSNPFHFRVTEARLMGLKF